MPKQTTYHIRRVLEYSEFFKDASPIDIPATLKLYSRNALLRMRLFLVSIMEICMFLIIIVVVLVRNIFF